MYEAQVQLSKHLGPLDVRRDILQSAGFTIPSDLRMTTNGCESQQDRAKGVVDYKSKMDAFEWELVREEVSKLFQCIQAGKYDQVWDCLERGILPYAMNEDGQTTLMAAVLAQQPRIFNLLVSWGTSDDAKDHWGDDVLVYLKRINYALFEPFLLEVLGEHGCRTTHLVNLFFATVLYDKNLVQIIRSYLTPRILCRLTPPHLVHLLHL